MKNSKKVELIVFICFCFILAIFLYSCESKNLDNSRTIVLTVDTDIVPTFSANYGNGVYDEIDKTYTHKIDDLKDLYIYLSYNELSTKTICIKTSQMSEKIIYMNVDYKSEESQLTANIYININGIKDLNNCSYSLFGDSYNDLRIFDKNTLCFITNTRKGNLNYQLKIDNYNDIDINLSNEEMKTGIFHIYTAVTENSQRYISVRKSFFTYELFDKSTNKLITSGSFSNNLKYNFIIVPDEKDYYVKIGNLLYHVPSNENLEIIPEEFTYNGELKELKVDGFPSNEEYSFRSFIDFENKKFISSVFAKKNVNNYGLIYGLNNGQNIEYYYLKSFKDVDTKLSDEFITYHFKKEDFTKVNLNFITYDLVSNEIIEGNNNDIFGKSFLLENNEFTVINRKLRDIKCSVGLVDQTNKKIDNVEINLSTDMINHFYNGLVKFNYKNVPLSFPIFIEDIEYDNERDIYTYPDQFVDTNRSLVSLSIIRDGYENSLRNEPLVLYDDDANIIRPIKLGENYYYELNSNKVYKVSYGKIIDFEVDENDLMIGNVCINVENRLIIDVTIPQGYTIQIQDDLSDSLVMMDDSHYKIILFIERDFCLFIGNKNVYFQYDVYINQVKNNNNKLEFKQFYCFKEFELDSLQSSSGKISLQKQDGSDGFMYFLTNPFDANKEISYLIFKIDKGINSSFEKFTLDSESIEYDESLQALTYDIKSLFDYMLIIKCDFYYKFTNAYSDGFIIYGNDDTTLIVDDSEYILKNLNLSKGETYVYMKDYPDKFIKYNYYFIKVANPNRLSLSDENFENKIYLKQYYDLFDDKLLIVSFYAPSTQTPVLFFGKDGLINIQINPDKDYYELK